MISRSSTGRSCVAALVAAMLIATPTFADPGSPDDIIRSAVAELNEKLEGQKDELDQDKEALYALINDILLPRFDRKLAAQLVLAKHWRTADEEQRERFIDAFYNSLLQKYADGLLAFDARRIEVIAFRGDTSAKRTLVKTVVTLDDGTRVPVHYDLVNRGDRWLMFNVKVEGISYISNYRTELDSEIRSTSLTRVIERLETEHGVEKHE